MCRLTGLRTVGHLFARTARFEPGVIRAATTVALDQFCILYGTRVNGGLCLLGCR
jgi:hypothetical protein